MTRGMLDGRIQATHKSALHLQGVVQIAQEESPNRVTDDSYLQAANEGRLISSPIVTSLLITRFSTLSRGLIANGSSVTDLGCGSAAEVFCDSSSPALITNCALCPVAVCPNGIREPGEQCDDNNPNNGDGSVGND